MKKLAFVLLGMTLSLPAAPPAPVTPMAPDPPPPVVVAPTPAPRGEVSALVVTNTIIVTNAIVVTNTILVTNPIPPTQFVYDQKLMGGRAPLVTPEQARAIIDIFHTNYAKLGNPRFLIYVNRDLVDENTGMKLAGRTERTEHSLAQGSVAYDVQKANNENSYRFQDRKEMPLPDRQTARDVERLFGRPLRLAGATLADQTVATQMLAGRNIKDFTMPVEGEQAHKDREALGKIADVVIEVLISSKNINVTRISGPQTCTIPDIQATAIRLSDSKTMAQASSGDLLGAGNPTPYAYDVHEVAEGTALALMQDMLLSVP